MKELLLVMAGGAVGSGLRYWIGTLLPIAPGAFPMPTFLVNIVGSFVLGCVVGASMVPDPLHRSLALALGTGLCGGFTTYSAFAGESVLLLQNGNSLVAITYLATTLVGGMLAAAGGLAIVRISAS